MRGFGKWLLVPSAIFAMACGRSDKPKLDDGLQNDLSLAASAQPYQPQQFVSPTEQGYAATPTYNQPRQYQTVSRASQGRAVPVYRAPSQPSVYRGSRSSGTYSAPAPQPVRHTQRDAAIGAAAGAVIGATTSRDKVKGGLIGAAAGGILGAIVGHTVDVSHP